MCLFLQHHSMCVLNCLWCTDRPQGCAPIAAGVLVILTLSWGCLFREMDHALELLIHKSKQKEGKYQPKTPVPEITQRIIEQFGLEGTLMIIQFQPP